MKSLITSIIILTSLFTKAQLWCPQGAEWNYTKWEGTYANGYETLLYTNDTTINSIQCKKIKQTFNGVSWDNSQFHSYTILFHYTYEQNKVVYYYDFIGNKFDTLYNFNPAIGSKWLTIQHPWGSCRPTERGFTTVLDTSHQIVNGTTLKTLSLEYSYTLNGTPMTQTVSVFEKIGPTNGYNFIFPYVCQMAIDPNYSSASPFRCYKDDSFALYSQLNPNTPNCYSITNTNELKGKGHLKFFPNPASLQITFEDTQDFNIKSIVIFDLLGNKIIEQGLQKGKTIDVSGLKPGFYTLQVVADDGKTINENLMIQ